MWLCKRRSWLCRLVRAQVCFTFIFLTASHSAVIHLERDTSRAQLPLMVSLPLLHQPRMRLVHVRAPHPTYQQPSLPTRQAPATAIPLMHKHKRNAPNSLHPHPQHHPPPYRAGPLQLHPPSHHLKLNAMHPRTSTSILSFPHL